jgi:hypothetical protein
MNIKSDAPLLDDLGLRLDVEVPALEHLGGWPWS